MKQAQVEQGMDSEQEDSHLEYPDHTLTHMHSWTLLIPCGVLRISVESVLLFTAMWVPFLCLCSYLSLIDLGLLLQDIFHKDGLMTYRFLKRKTVHNFKGVIRELTLFFYLYYKTPLLCYHDFLKNSFSLSKKVFKSLCNKMCCRFKYCQAVGGSCFYCQYAMLEI